MHRIDGPGATVDKKFTEGDPANAVPATDVTAEWLNAVQEELAAVVEGSGLVLSKTDSQQLLKALGSRIKSVGTIADLQLLNTAALSDGQQVSVADAGIYEYKAERGVFEPSSVSASNGSEHVGYRGRSVASALDAAKGPLELIAHTGFALQAPPNTMLAISTAPNRGADSVELDVVVSGDGTPHLLHDTSVDALTNGTGAVAELSDAYLAGLTLNSVAGTPFAAERIPKLSDALAFAKKRGIDVYPEIKGYRTQADLDLILQAVIDAGMVERCVFISFDLSDLQYLRGLHPYIRLGYLGMTSNQVAYEAAIADAVALGNCLISWRYNVLLATPAIIDRARESGVGVVAWTVNSLVDANKLIDMGVTRITSDISLEL